MIVFISGGARSGKSHLAESMARTAAGSGQIAYIATGQPVDLEFTARILHHRQRRGLVFDTIEEPFRIDHALAQALETHQVVVVECITTWLGNLFHRAVTENPNSLFTTVEDQAATCLEHLIAAASQHPEAVILIVSNEVGLGLVPPDAMSRAYRDSHGRINCRIAEAADQMWLVVSGIPLKLK